MVWVIGYCGRHESVVILNQNLYIAKADLRGMKEASRNATHGDKLGVKVGFKVLENQQNQISQY